MSFRGVAVTTGNSQIAVCQNLCRVLKHGHTANRTFAVCQKKQHTAKVQLTAIILFAVCPPKKHTAKAQHTANMCVCRVLKKDAHGKPLAHGKKPALPMPGCRVCFVVCGTRQRVCRSLLGLYRVPLAHGKGGVSRSEGWRSDKWGHCERYRDVNLGKKFQLFRILIV